MHLKNYLQSKMHLFGILGLALIMSSCGSYQYAGYDDDAIYSNSEKNVEYEETTSETETTSENSGYYKNYFKEKSNQYDNIIQDEAIFTDIDSYESEGGEVDYAEEGYAGWGQDNQDVVINVYGGHLYNSIWWNRPYYTAWGWNYGWNNYWGWNNGFGYGWNNWGWNAGFGWGWSKLGL